MVLNSKGGLGSISAELPEQSELLAQHRDFKEVGPRPNNCIRDFMRGLEASEDTKGSKLLLYAT